MLSIKFQSQKVRCYPSHTSGVSTEIFKSVSQKNLIFSCYKKSSMRLSVGLFVKERGIGSLRFYEIGSFQILYKFDVRLDTARSSKIEYILNIT